jgi:hypothetical protein
MKSTTMLMAAAAALFALHSTGAVAQEACSKDYVGCIDSCVKNPTKSFQDRCINACQAKNDQCSEKVYGERKPRQPATVVQSPRGASEALARTHEGAPAATRAPAQPQVRPQAHPQVRAPAPRQVEAAPAPQPEAPAPRAAAEPPAPAQPRR